MDARMKRSENPSELRPVEGPINIEQLPAMLAARSVKRYPYSQQDDPAMMSVNLNLYQIIFLFYILVVDDTRSTYRNLVKCIHLGKSMLTNVYVIDTVNKLYLTKINKSVERE
jgi:hypothetical protein